jgi:hypothetical protein
MNSLFNLEPQQLRNLYNTLLFSKNKDKINMILEPLQAIIQLCLLSISPIGTKLSIHENVLNLQIPSVIQPISRWYYNDSKDNLFYLFQVIKRFIKWYNPGVNKNTPLTLDLYLLIIKMSCKGLDNLLKTYSSHENNTLTQVINMYKNLLEYCDATEIDNIFNNDKIINIDEIFEKIIFIYPPQLITIIYNSLSLLEKEENIDNITNYVNGLNIIMYSNNKNLKNWIKNNLNP